MLYRRTIPGGSALPTGCVPALHSGSRTIRRLTVLGRSLTAISLSWRRGSRARRRVEPGADMARRSRHLDLDTGKAILRDYINATIGFDELSRRTKLPAKSLMRMLGPSGNPQARNLLEVIRHLQKAEGLQTFAFGLAVTSGFAAQCTAPAGGARRTERGMLNQLS